MITTAETISSPVVGRGTKWTQVHGQNVGRVVLVTGDFVLEGVTKVEFQWGAPGAYGSGCSALPLQAFLASYAPNGRSAVAALQVQVDQAGRELGVAQTMLRAKVSRLVRLPQSAEARRELDLAADDLAEAAARQEKLDGLLTAAKAAAR
jgi:hypothetical protein